MAAQEKTSENILSQSQSLRVICIAICAIAIFAGVAWAQNSTDVTHAQTFSAVTKLKLENVYVLGGKTFKATVRWKPDALVTWQFGYQDNMIKEGTVKLDAEGCASVRLVAPEIRHRVVCKFVIVSSKPAVSQEIVVYPASTLASAAKILKKLDIGIIDDTGNCKQALTSEKIDFTDLETTLARDSFSGGMVILCGFKSGHEMAAECGKLSGRINDGMLAVVINPAEDWKAFGIEMVKLEKPVTGQIHVEENFAESSIVGDIDKESLQLALKGKEDSRALVWLEGEKPIAAKQDAEVPQTQTVKHLLVLAQPVGKGWVVVAILPQMKNPADNAVGRAVLDRSVLWTAGCGLLLKTSGEK